MKILFLFLAVFCFARLSVSSPGPVLLNLAEFTVSVRNALIEFKGFVQHGNKLNTDSSTIEMETMMMTLLFSVNNDEKIFNVKVSDNFALPESLIVTAEDAFKLVARTIFPNSLPGVLMPTDDGRLTAYLTWLPSADHYRFIFSFRLMKTAPSATPLSLLLHLFMAEEE